MYKLSASSSESLEFTAQTSTLGLKILLTIFGFIGIFLLLLAALFFWLIGVGSASFQITLGVGIFLGGASLMLRNHSSGMNPEPDKIIINRHNVEFRAPDGSLQLRLPAADIEDFTLVHYSQSGSRYYIIACLQFRDGSIFPLQQFLREDMAAAQLAPLRESCA